MNIKCIGLIVILILILIFAKPNREHLEVTVAKSTNEAIQNIASVYANKDSTMTLNKLNVTNGAIIGGNIRLNTTADASGTVYDLATSGMQITSGPNKWYLHVPINQKSLIIAPAKADGSWNWGNSFTIDNVGNVGVNGTLTVNGDIKTTGNLAVGGRADVTAGAGISDGLNINGNTNINGDLQLNNLAYADGAQVTGSGRLIFGAGPTAPARMSYFVYNGNSATSGLRVMRSTGTDNGWDWNRQQQMFPLY